MTIMKSQKHYDEHKFEGKCPHCGQIYLELKMDILKAEAKNLEKEMNRREELWLEKYKEMKEPKRLVKGHFLHLLLLRSSRIPDNYRYTWKDIEKFTAVFARKLRLLRGEKTYSGEDK